MQTDFLNSDQVRHQATVAGFDRVEEYVLNLIHQDRERQAILEGLADLEAGRCVSLEEFDADFRKSHSIPSFE